MAIDRPLERAVLVRLALANRVAVPDARLARDLWGAEIERPVQRLRVVVSRLRATLGAHAGVIARTPAGYQTSAVVADLLAAEAAAQRMHTAQRGGDWPVIAESARAALSLWRGEALADLRAIPFARIEGERLDDWRLMLTVAGLQANLELGAPDEVVTELAALVARYPLHEPLGCLLALALYRSGRQGAALERLARLRRVLAEELGVDPAPDTARLEMRILDHDPALRAAASVELFMDAPVSAGSVATEAPVTGPVTSFLGRGREFAALSARSARPGLITVTGVAGSGKSRLAIELARAAANSGRRVVHVELAPLTGDDDVAPAGMAALESAGLLDGTDDPVAAFGPQVLLILDNAEHVRRGVREFIRTATGSSVLVTSQAPLGAPGESVYPLGPLDRGVAVALFTERAGLGGLVTAAEREDVVRICAALDWLPLGIELAAGLTRTLTIAQLATRIDDRVRLLVGGARNAGGGRHTSLRVALDWSHELLADRERAVLRRLGVFAGGCTLEAAEAVLPDPGGGIAMEVGDIAPALADLVNRSLVSVQSDSGTRRFTLLETVRDYALSRAAEAGELEALRAAHLSWCRDLVAVAGAPDDFAAAEAVASVFAEWPNILAALEHAPGTPRAADGLRLANAMHVPWLARAWFPEARKHFSALVVDAIDLPPAELAQALSHYGFHELMGGALERAADLLARAAEVAAPLGDAEPGQTVRYYQGIVDIERARLSTAIEHLRTGEALAERDSQAASFADALGTALLYSGDAVGALAAYRRSAEFDKAANDEHGLSRGLSNEAKALLDLGDTAAALAAVEQSDRYARRLDDRQILPLNDLTRAAVARAAGELDAAESYCRAAFEHEGATTGMARVDLADVLIVKGEWAEAATLLDGLRGRAYGIPLLAARAVETSLRAARGDAIGAAELAATLRAEFVATGFGWHRYADRILVPNR
ncbi:hypothetical protein D5S18_08820 [Nocardia panacis]|uniref:Bacterial transcriptional activator domain-containing protein n=1 Tax=Nocardia panacis TaxID=2340916 RepID=A0A3A4JYN0_9NOCA|nr:BTAD domain-containing putative transcriptional regulator [Nocardia panacis]RJO76415.1 hypothetical protein D5S18_08820 [Nocardia panacis]